MVIDSDGGEVSCDALWVALSHPGLDVIAVIAEAGVISALQSSRNLAKVLDAAGRSDIPVAVGEAPHGPTRPLPVPPAVADGDGLGGYHRGDPPTPARSESGSVLLARCCAGRPRRVVVAALGPAHERGSCAGRAPLAGRNRRRVVAMGGALHVAGNATPTAEYNVALDPLAADRLFSTPWADPPALVPLDVTLRAPLGPTELDTLAERRTPAARFLAAPLERYAQFAAAPDGTVPTRDALAVLAIAEPDLLSWRTATLDVDRSDGPEWARVQARPPVEGRTWRIATDVDVGRVRARLRRVYGG